MLATEFQLCLLYVVFSPLLAIEHEPSSERQKGDGHRLRTEEETSGG